jgi:hypothetical protein
MHDLTFDEICKRAGGRRRYNAWRQFMREFRRIKITHEILQTGDYYGVQADLARKFGVHPSTISRDLAFIRRGCKTGSEIDILDIEEEP